MNAPTNIEAESRRRLFTVDEVLAMQRLGVFADTEKFELIEGELDPEGETWRDVRVCNADEAIAPLAFPNAVIRLADLEF